MSTKTAPVPEYIGGPLCGDSISVNAPSVVRVINPLVGGNSAGTVAKGTFVYHRQPDGRDFTLVEVRG